MPGESDLPQTLDLSQLLAGPLIALVDADAHAALRLAEFVREVGFVNARRAAAAPTPAAAGTGDTAGRSNLGELRTVAFQYRKTGPDGLPRTCTAEIPVLSLVTLPKLQVSEAQFEYSIRVHGSAPTAGATQAPASVPGAPAPVRLLGAVAHSPESPAARAAPATQGNLQVRITVRQADMPAGLSQLLNIMGNSAMARPDQGRTE